MLLRYLKEKRWLFLLLLLSAGVFAGVFALYGFPFEAVLYPTAVCLVFIGIYFEVDYLRARGRHKRFSEIRSVPFELPEAQTAADEDYERVIELLRDEMRRLSEEESRRCAEMTDYYTVWAHQIKTPIASMRLRLQNEDTPKARQLYSELLRIEQYVSMAMTYLRLDSSETDYLFREYPLDDIIRQAAKRFSGDFIAKKLSFALTPTEKAVVTDKKWLTFVLEQLLSNAVKYTKEGGVSVFMQGRELCIRDTGIGIEASDLPRIFERGYTGGIGRLDERASGIGLYLCRRVCRNLGMGIRAASEPGQGTTIFLAFPEK